MSCGNFRDWINIVPDCCQGQSLTVLKPFIKYLHLIVLPLFKPTCVSAFSCGKQKLDKIGKCVVIYSLSCVRLFVTLWTVACQAPLSMGFPRQEYWDGLWFLSPGDLPDAGMEPASPVSLALAGRFFTTEPLGKPSEQWYLSNYLVYLLAIQLPKSLKQNLKFDDGINVYFNR